MSGSNSKNKYLESQKVNKKKIFIIALLMVAVGVVIAFSQLPNKKFRSELSRIDKYPNAQSWEISDNIGIGDSYPNADVTFTTTSGDSISDVSAFYKNHLMKNNWVFEGTIGAEMYIFTKSGKTLTISTTFNEVTGLDDPDIFRIEISSQKISPYKSIE